MRDTLLNERRLFMHKKLFGFLLLLSLTLTLLFGLALGTAHAGEPPYGEWLGGDLTGCTHPEGEAIHQQYIQLGNGYHAEELMCGVTGCGAIKYVKSACDFQTFPASEGDPNFPAGTLVDYCGKCNFMRKHEGGGSSSSATCTHPEEYLGYSSYGMSTHTVLCLKCNKHFQENHTTLTVSIAPNPQYPFGAKNYSCTKCDLDQTIANVPDVSAGGGQVNFSEENGTFFQTGEEIKPEVTLSVTVDDGNGGTVTSIVDKEHYTVEYENNVDVGTAKVTIIGDGEVIKGKITKEFTIVKCPHPSGMLKYENKSDSAHSVYCTNCKTDLDLEDHAYAQITVTQEATCTENAVLERKCVCGRVDTENAGPKEGENADWFAHHNWGNTYESDFWQHWTFCTRCGTPSEKQAHELTNITVLIKNDCIENGSIQADCSVCGRKGMVFSAGIESEAAMFPALQQYKALGHDFSGPLKYNKSSCTSEGEGNHAPSCIRCGIRDSENAAPHTWGGWDYVSQGSCKEPKEDVVRTATCECGAKLTLTYPREHVWVDDKSQDVQATCTESGRINGQRCTICGIFGNYDFVPALGHNIEVIDQLEATCLTEGYKHIKCSNPGCDIDETTTIPTLGGDGQHHFKPVASQEPTCTTDGQYNGEKCENCPAEQAGETGYGTIPALGHKVVSSTASHGKTRTAVSKDGRPIEMQLYVTTFSCKRCGASLGGETFTVATSIGKMGGQYLIESGNVTITDMGNGIHINGNMERDGGVRFNEEVQKGLDEVIKDAGAKYTYKKVETKSFVIEFTDEFLAEIEDGEYELVVINGSEYWPMMVTVSGHKFKALRDVDVPDMPELTEDEFNALLAELGADGGVVSRFMLVQPGIEAAPNENGDIVVTRKDGDYEFEAIVCGEYTLVADQDYTVDGDTVTLKADYLNGLTGEQEITFRYAPFDMEGAPAPHNPKLTVGK